ncbi:4Fe-4S binding protein [Desulfosediminicola ganghwensis]|uniref:4Fe-4S binding protein n=1 Tax=Desulfosediminicola ganghwensis TaxID=2569540 RepID=UPI0010AD3ACF|nr:4Fe-4S binding protein [Desulfosediminicola ganghwensis]
MSDNFSMYLFTQRSGSQPELLRSEVNLRPGHPFEVDSLESILLASGFPAVTPNMGFPLSPTLQINADLARHDEELLSRIGQAELDKLRAVNFRSFSVDHDPRLCVIGSDVAAIKKFADTYGGVLEVEPILLKGFDPEIPTATEIALSRDADGFSIEYSVRVPVNSGRCTYCGACGQACPESCLDEQLFIDYPLCTFCKECEKACPHDALDVYGAERRVMRIPAILIMDGTEVDLPENYAGIYTEQELEKFWATQYSCQVDEVVTCDTSICQYSGKLGYGCGMCIGSCPHGAIQATGNGIKVDSLKCEECGGCIATCPTGAMQYQRFTDESFINYLQTVGLEAGCTVVLGSEKALHKLWWQRGSEIEGNCLYICHDEVRALSLFHLLALYVLGAGRMVLLVDEDQAHFEDLKRQATLATSLIKTYCEVPEPVVISNVSDFTGKQFAPAHYPLAETFTEAFTGNRRENLAVILQYLTEKSGRQARIKGHPQLPFATVSCNAEGCTQCFACLNMCRIQALSTNEDQLVLRSKGALCVGCGGCVRVCPEKVLSLTPGATLDDTWFEPQTIAEAEPMKCKRCGKVFGSKKTFEKVMGILASKESVDTSHFEYCEDCRVINLFEGE